MVGVAGGICQGLERQLGSGIQHGARAPRQRTGMILPLHQPPGICAILASPAALGLAGPGQAIGTDGAAGADSELINFSRPWQETDREQLVGSLVLH